eukprot:1586319-Pyramimonas_sp.AAC.1
MAWHCTVKRSQRIDGQSVASHSGAQRSTARHAMSWRRIPWRASGSSSRGLGRSGAVARCLAPAPPKKQLQTRGADG